MLSKMRRTTKRSLGRTLPFIHKTDGENCGEKKNKRHASIHYSFCRETVMAMTQWVFLGSLSMITRCIAIYQSPYRLREVLYFPLFIGLMQDVIIIFQALVIAGCARMLFGFGDTNKSSSSSSSSSSLFITSNPSTSSTLAAVFCNVVPFLDILLQLQNCPRVDIGFVINLCYNFRIFYPSLKQAASSWVFASLCMTWFVFISLGSSFLTNYINNKIAEEQLRLFRGKWRMSIVLVIIFNYTFWAICTAFYRKQDQSIMYCVENVIFKLQQDMLGNADSTRDIQHLTVNAVENVTLTSEIYTMPELELSELLGSASYPTLRKTIGYRGPKLFDIMEPIGDGKEKEEPNILLIMMESWKDLRYLGPDARRIITPQFDELCTTGIHFDAHYTPSLQTSRSLVSNLFGNLPGTLVEPAIKQYPTLNLKGLPTLTKAKGYHNAFISAVDLKWDNWHKQLPRLGFDQLEGWRDINQLLRDRNYPPVETEHEGNWGLWDEKGFNGLYEHMVDWKANGTKFLVNFYSISSHWPYQIKNSYDVPKDIEQFARTEDDHNYLATMAYSDQHLGRFISKCRQTGLLNNTIVLIQGDHGGPSPVAQVNGGVRDEATHSPALLLADGLLPPGQVGKSISQVSSQADVFATVADIIGIPEGGMLNHGIGSSMMRKHPDKIVFLENPFKAKTIGCRQGDIKIVQEGTSPPKVYNMSLDPFEENPLSSFDANKTTALIEMTRKLVGMFSSLYGMNQFLPGD